MVSGFEFFNFSVTAYFFHYFIGLLSDTLRNEFFKLNIWEHFKKLTKYYQTNNLNIIKYHLSSCDNLLELECGKQLFADSTVAYSILTNLNEFILLNLNEYTEDFFIFLDTICGLSE